MGNNSLFKACILMAPAPGSTKEEPKYVYMHNDGNGGFELKDAMKGAVTFNQEDAQKVIDACPGQNLTMMPVE